jgi:vacuolar protein sorting-associated protein 11
MLESKSQAFAEHLELQSPAELATVASSSAGVLLADFNGSIHILNRDFEASKSWVAYSGGRVTHMVEHRGILVTLGVSLHSAFPPRSVF